jgi:outer membrane protein
MWFSLNNKGAIEVKKYIVFAAAVFLFGSRLSFSQESPQKTGYVDSQVILNQLPEAIKAQGDITALQDKWVNEGDKLTKKLQDDYAAYQKKAKSLTQEQQLAEQQKLLKEQQSIDDFKKAKFGQPNGEFYVESDSIWKPIKDKIYHSIEVVGKNENMTYVLDKAGNAIVLYADPKYDITYKVLDYLQTGTLK